MLAWKIVHLKVLSGHRLELAFADGLRGVVDLSGEEFRGVLAPLADPAFFARAELRNGVPTWPGDLDLAPDGLYADLRRSKAEEVATA